MNEIPSNLALYPEAELVLARRPVLIAIRHIIGWLASHRAQYGITVRIGNRPRRCGDGAGSGMKIKQQRRTNVKRTFLGIRRWPIWKSASVASGGCRFDSSSTRSSVKTTCFVFGEWGDITGLTLKYTDFHRGLSSGCRGAIESEPRVESA
jgi:hypothetical protein